MADTMNLDHLFPDVEDEDDDEEEEAKAAEAALLAEEDAWMKENEWRKFEENSNVWSDRYGQIEGRRRALEDAAELERTNAEARAAAEAEAEESAAPTFDEEAEDDGGMPPPVSVAPAPVAPVAPAPAPAVVADQGEAYEEGEWVTYREPGSAAWQIMTSDEWYGRMPSLTTHASTSGGVPLKKPIFGTSVPSSSRIRAS